jgi:chemotaxis response regulator CheB
LRLNPDLLVLDVSMPDFEPISAVQQIKADHPVDILIVSAMTMKPMWWVCLGSVWTDIT